MEKPIILTDVFGTIIDKDNFQHQAKRYYKAAGRDYGIKTFGEQEIQNMEETLKKDPLHEKYFVVLEKIYQHGLEEKKIVPRSINGIEEFYLKCTEMGYRFATYSSGTTSFIREILKNIKLGEDNSLADLVDNYYAAHEDIEHIGKKADVESYMYIMSRENGKVSIFFSDDIREVRAAAKAGLVVYYINPKHKGGKIKETKNNVSYYVIRDYRELKPGEWEEKQDLDEASSDTEEEVSEDAEAEMAEAE